MIYKIKIDIDAFEDIKNTSFWYGNQLKGLDIRYKTQVIKQISFLKKNPYLYSIKYNDVHCLKVKKFPFLIHYKIDEISKTINVFAIIHTSRNPEIWLKK